MHQGKDQLCVLRHCQVLEGLCGAKVRSGGVDSGQHWLRSGSELGSYERGNEGCVQSHVSAMNTGLQGPKGSIQPLPQAAMTCTSPKLGPRLGD